ncbi:MAG: hypothetical protein ABJA62_07015, partial [Luteimonas sp.]
ALAAEAAGADTLPAIELTLLSSGQPAKPNDNNAPTMYLRIRLLRQPDPDVLKHTPPKRDKDAAP